MVSNLDLFRSAQILINQYGEDAPGRALLQVDQFLEKGDKDGHAVWRRVAEAVREVLRTEPPDGVTSH